MNRTQLLFFNKISWESANIKRAATMLRTILILTALIVFSGNVFAGDTSDVVWKKDYPLQGSQFLTLSPNEYYLCAAAGNKLRIMNAQTGVMIRTSIIESATGISSLSFFPDSDKLAFTTFTAQSQNLVVYSISKDKIIENIAYENYDDYDPCVYCDVSPDGTNIITCGSFVGKDNIWIHNTETFDIIKKIGFYNETKTSDKYFPRIIKYSPTGKYLAALANVKDYEGYSLHTILKIWNTETWESFTFLDPMNGSPNGLNFSDDEKYLAALSGSDLNIIDVRYKKTINPIDYQYAVWQAAFNDNKVAIAASKFMIYDIETTKRCYEYDFLCGGFAMTKSGMEVG